MVKNEDVILWLPEATTTASAGESLARTLYTFPLTAHCRGDLGVGKTTFIQGFAKGLGVTERITSPTFALEQRYTCMHGKLLHLDLYRLQGDDADLLLETSQHDADIRCIEWMERAEGATAADIEVELTEEQEGRKATVTFRDVSMPSVEQIAAWQEEVSLPMHIRNHCAVVAEVAVQCAENLLQRGILVRKETLRRAALLHDLFRFVDFHPRGSTVDFPITADALETWDRWKARYSGQKHEAACANFLQEKGFLAIGRIVRTHGLTLPSPPKTTTEQQLLFYADKRVRNDEVVTLAERFEDFQKRYGPLHGSVDRTQWYEESLAIEKVLFPKGAPDIGLRD
jgi:tRNA threonylcarbamoyladenosine biosynthesis protein TsaE